MKVFSISTLATTCILLFITGGISQEGGFGVDAGLEEWFIRMIVIPFAAIADGDVATRRGRRSLAFKEAMDRTKIQSTELGLPNWDDAKEKCSHVEYDIKLLIETRSGHVQGYVEPSKAHNTDNIDEKVCLPVVIHTIAASEAEMDGRVVAMHWIPKEMEEEFWKTEVAHDLGVTLPFGEIVDAFETVKLNESTTYLNSIVPTNCASHLLDLGNRLHVPIDNDTVSFVLKHMKETKFMETFTTSSIYKTLSMASWFGDGRRLGQTIGTDPESMLRRLTEYMLKQHYPSELIRM